MPNSVIRIGTVRDRLCLLTASVSLAQPAGLVVDTSPLVTWSYWAILGACQHDKSTRDSTGTIATRTQREPPWPKIASSETTKTWFGCI